jgi:hypothetical protein
MNFTGRCGQTCVDPGMEAGCAVADEVHGASKHSEMAAIRIVAGRITLSSSAVLTQDSNMRAAAAADGHRSKPACKAKARARISKKPVARWSLRNISRSLCRSARR